MANYPTFTLQRIKDLINRGGYFCTKVAMDGAALHGFGKEDIEECLLDFLSDSDFYQTIESNNHPGTMLDVYECEYSGIIWYVKLKIVKDSAWVVSFKESTSFRAKAKATTAVKEI